MKVAVIGLGAVAQVHVKALVNRKQDIVALCDIRRERCEETNEKFRLNARVYESYKDLLEKEEVEAIHICTPHYLHAEMICECLKRNVNVLCEKPLAINQKQLDTIERAVRSSAAQLGICFQHRFREAPLYVRNFLKDKKIVSASAALTWERNADYYAQDEWRGTWAKEGGGVMINQAIHSLDLIQWICGRPDSVTAYTSNISLKKEIEVEDTAFGLFKTKDGGNIVVNATNAAKFCFPIYYMFKTEDDLVELSSDNIIINGKFVIKSDGTPTFGKEEWGVGHQKLIFDFYDCLEQNRPFSIGFEEAQNAVRMIIAMYRSHGQEIKV